MKELNCKFCSTAIRYSEGTMVVVKDHIWKEICDKAGISTKSILCQSCMEKYLGRPINLDDLKYSDEDKGIMLPCNFWISKRLNETEGRPLRYYTIEEYILKMNIPKKYEFYTSECSKKGKEPMSYAKFRRKFIAGRIEAFKTIETYEMVFKD